MKVRVVGLVLAAVVLVSATLTAFAATTGEESEPSVEVVTPPPAVVEEVTEPAQPEPPFYVFHVNGEPVETLVYQVLNYTYYVTVESFVTALDCEAMVEEEDGTVTVNAVTVTQDERRRHSAKTR